MEVMFSLIEVKVFPIGLSAVQLLLCTASYHNAGSPLATTAVRGRARRNVPNYVALVVEPPEFGMQKEDFRPSISRLQESRQIVPPA